MRYIPPSRPRRVCRALRHRLLGLHKFVRREWRSVKAHAATYDMWSVKMFVYPTCLGTPPVSLTQIQVEHERDHTKLAFGITEKLDECRCLTRQVTQHLPKQGVQTQTLNMPLARPRANSLFLPIPTTSPWDLCRPPTPRRATLPLLSNQNIPHVPPLSFWNPDTPSPHPTNPQSPSSSTPPASTPSSFYS
jgi:hypothetical protein